MKTLLHIFYLLLAAFLVVSCEDNKEPETEPPTAPAISFDAATYTMQANTAATITGAITCNTTISSVKFYHVKGSTEEHFSSEYPNATSSTFTKAIIPTSLTTGMKVEAVNSAGMTTIQTVPITIAGTTVTPPVTVTAFPGAEGFGCMTTGGRGGTVYYVTTLEDNNSGNAATNEGSLRWAIGRPGPRTIIFKVAGIIELQSKLNITGGSLTIAGQTAPGDGICIKNYTVENQADNVIIRYIRFRMGDEKATADDALWGRNRRNIIIDHCSLSWCTDECGSFYDNENFTLQWCILSESLRISVHDKGAHGYGGIWGGRKASFHHNLLAHHDSRNPRFCGSRYSNRESEELVDFRNNVIYNWGANSGYAGEGGRYNMVNNYYKPAAGSANNTRIFQPYPDDGSNAQQAGVWGKFYVAGNFMTSSTAVTNDNWQGIHPNPSSKDKEELKSTVEFEKGEIATQTAHEAYISVLAEAGASLKRDAIDVRVINEVSNGLAPIRAYYTLNPTLRPIGVSATRAGMIDSQTDVGGWDTYTFNPADVPVYSVPDGIPLSWLQTNGLQVGDGPKFAPNGYTNLENYLNSLVE
ncbi:MAG: pectate lyase [Bacteroidales bacterium]|nr:pectate lyase [Bacteroidales bacterium]MCL2133539.1 pectate lyase [Bacteroidales bacterium]